MGIVIEEIVGEIVGPPQPAGETESAPPKAGAGDDDQELKMLRLLVRAEWRRARLAAD